MIQDFDPRYKIFLALLLSYISFAMDHSLGLMVNYVLVLFLFFIIRAGESAFKVGLFVLILFALNFFFLEFFHLVSVFRFLEVGVIFLLKLSTFGIMIYWISLKMKTGHFIVAMQSLRLPKSVIIILAVVLRFFPTLKVELSCIKNAMKLRGIHFTLKNLLIKPFRTLEYTGVPLIMRSMTVSDQLSAAAVSRGLDLKGKNTSYIPLSMKAGSLALTLSITFLSLLNLYFSKTLY